MLSGLVSDVFSATADKRGAKAAVPSQLQRGVDGVGLGVDEAGAELDVGVGPEMARQAVVDQRFLR
eukprot:3978224-Lingulodinium_polyedra.AAC.1